MLKEPLRERGTADQMASKMVAMTATVMAAVSVGLTVGARASRTVDSKEMSMDNWSEVSKASTMAGKTVVLTDAQMAVQGAASMAATIVAKWAGLLENHLAATKVE